MSIKVEKLFVMVRLCRNILVRHLFLSLCCDSFLEEQAHSFDGFLPEPITTIIEFGRRETGVEHCNTLDETPHNLNLCLDPHRVHVSERVVKASLVARIDVERVPEDDKDRTAFDLGRRPRMVAQVDRFFPL